MKQEYKTVNAKLVNKYGNEIGVFYDKSKQVIIYIAEIKVEQAKAIGWELKELNNDQ